MDNPVLPSRLHAVGSGSAAMETLGSAPREQHSQGLTSTPLPHESMPQQPNYINPEDKLQSVYVLPLLWSAMLGRRLRLTASFSPVYFLSKLKGLEATFLCKNVCIYAYVHP